MFETLFGEKGKTIGNLFSSSFRLLGEDRVKSLLVSRCLFSVICHILALLAITLMVYKFHAGLGWLLFFFLIFCVYPYSFFFHVNKRAGQTWAAYGKITNRPTTDAEINKVISSQKWPLRMFALVELALAKANNTEQSQGIMSLLVASALAALEGLFDVAESYLLPALIIERIPLTAAADKLKQLKQNIPTTLAGAFGLDVFGGVVSSLLFFIYAGIILMAGAAAWGAAHIASFPQTLIATLPLNHSTVHVFIFPILLAIVLVSLIHSLIKILVTSMKATYFAVFYTAINKPEEIRADMKDKIIVYLQTPAPAQPGANTAFFRAEG